MPLISRPWKRRACTVLLVLVGVLLVVRLLAPYYVKGAIDRRLAAIPGYSGHVEGIVLHLWRGAYRINGITIVKKDNKVSEPFFCRGPRRFLDRLA